jgi:hypothetical protein
MEELWLEENKIELPTKSVYQTLQINDLAELKDRQANYTNRFKIPMTPNNMRALDYLGVSGNTSQLPYRKVSAKLVVGGIELISNGYAQIKSAGGNYQVVIYDGNFPLYDEIKGKTISSLDLQDLNHYLTIPTYQNSFSNTEGYIYGIGNFGYSSVSSQINIERQAPSVFVHTLWDKIFTEAGFTYSGDIFQDESFLSEVITPVKGFDVIDSGPAGNYVDFSLFMPETLQTAFAQDLMQRYGLISRPRKNSMHYEFIQIEKMLNDREGAEDWSDKLKAMKPEEYSIGDYGRSNYATYNYEDDVANFTHNGTLSTENENYQNEKSLFSSIYKISRQVGTHNGEPIYLIPIWENVVEDGNNVVKNKETDVRIFKIKKIDSTINIRYFSILNTATIMGNIPYLSLESVEYQFYLNKYYSGFKRILDAPKKRKDLFYLTLADIYNIDFFSLKYIKQLGQYYYLT